MPKYAHPDVLDGGLLAIKNGATAMVLIKDYTAGDSYATVIGNALATASMVPTDYTLGSSGTSRTVTTPSGKTATAIAASVAGQGDHHIAFTDGSAKVLWVTDETGELPNNVGDTIIFPSVTYTSNQPV